MSKRMPELSVRINLLLSRIDQNHRNLIKCQVKCNMQSESINTLCHQYNCTEPEATQLMFLITHDTEQNTNINSNKKSSTFHQLHQKYTKIRLAQSKLKNLNMAKPRKRLGPVAQDQMNILNDVNNADLDHVAKDTIEPTIKKLLKCEKHIQEKEIKSNEDTNNLLTLDIKEYCQKLRDDHQKKRIKNRNKKKKVGNEISRSIVCKYSQLRDFLCIQQDIINDLEKQEIILKEIAFGLNIFDNTEQCHQELQWKSVLEQDETTITLKAPETYKRIKKSLKLIRKIKNKCNQNISKIKSKTNETIWKAEGRLKSKDTLAERAKKYIVTKAKKRHKYAAKKRAIEETDIDIEVNEKPRKQRKLTLQSYFCKNV